MVREDRPVEERPRRTNRSQRSGEREEA
jgi:hypothetical protein